MLILSLSYGLTFGAWYQISYITETDLHSEKIKANSPSECVSKCQRKNLQAVLVNGLHSCTCIESKGIISKQQTSYRAFEIIDIETPLGK